MSGIQLRDEAVRDRVRAAQEFLDPSQYRCNGMRMIQTDNELKMIREPAAIAQISFSC